MEQYARHARYIQVHITRLVLHALHAYMRYMRSTHLLGDTHAQRRRDIAAERRGRLW